MKAIFSKTHQGARQCLTRLKGMAFTRIATGLAVILTAAVAPLAHGISFDVELAFTDATFTGIIETTDGDGIKTPDNGGLMSFDFTVYGETFAANDDVGFPDFPTVELEVAGTEIVSVNFLGLNSNAAILSISFGSNNDVFFQPGTASSGNTGTLSYTATSVPETTSAMLLFAIGIASCGLLKGRKRQVP